jgi:hypothetical protein
MRSVRSAATSRLLPVMAPLGCRAVTVRWAGGVAAIPTVGTP